MIYTVTLNPALDYILEVNDLKPGFVNRPTLEHLLAGGKGLNVSTVLSHLGMESIALGFTAGFTGAEIKRRFEASGCKSDFIELKEGCSRINVKIKSDKETELNAAGPVIDNDSVAKLTEKISLLKNGDILILAGSIPSPLSASLYGDIMKLLSGRDILIAVDAAKEQLLHTLPYHPFLIKPNHHELGELFGITITSQEAAAVYAKKLQEQGARNVLVSMAGDGAVFLTENGALLKSKAPKGIIKNSVGAGDSMLAGFIAGWCEKHTYAHAFGLGIASGSASAFSEGLAEKKEIERIYAISQTMVTVSDNSISSGSISIS